MVFVLAAIEMPSSIPVQSGASLSINFKFKDNSNLLRNKQTNEGYEVLEDGYGATIWVEGPYDPAVPCKMKSSNP